MKLRNKLVSEDKNDNDLLSTTEVLARCQELQAEVVKLRNDLNNPEGKDVDRLSAELMALIAEIDYYLAD